MNGNLSCLSLENFSFDTENIADIIFLKPLILFCSDVISLYIHLDSALLILNVNERCLSHITECHDTSGNRNFLIFHRLEIVFNILAVRRHIPFFNKKRISAGFL